MSDLHWGDIVPLLELAVVLNGGYFTFRHATNPSQARHDATIQYLRKLMENNPVVSRNVALTSKIIILAHRHADFKEEIETSYIYFDAVLLCAGYSICIVYSIGLFIASTLQGGNIPYIVAVILFIVGYLPVFGSIIFELYRFIRSFCLFSQAVRLLRTIDALVKQQRREASGAAC